MQQDEGHGRLLTPRNGGYAGSQQAEVPLRCGERPVTPVARNRDDGDGFDAARVPAAYAAAQGPRLGCGRRPVRVSGRPLAPTTKAARAAGAVLAATLPV
ncbi:hypothetical protein [Streptomyces sp. NPDC054783]